MLLQPVIAALACPALRGVAEMHGSGGDGRPRAPEGAAQPPPLPPPAVGVATHVVMHGASSKRVAVLELHPSVPRWIGSGNMHMQQPSNVRDKRPKNTATPLHPLSLSLPHPVPQPAHKGRSLHPPPIC